MANLHYVDSAWPWADRGDGPKRHGKTTTLRSMLARLDRSVLILNIFIRG